MDFPSQVHLMPIHSNYPLPRSLTSPCMVHILPAQYRQPNVATSGSRLQLWSTLHRPTPSSTRIPDARQPCTQADAGQLCLGKGHTLHPASQKGSSGAHTVAPASRFSCPFCWGAGTAAEAFILISLGRQFIERLALRIDKDACYLLTLPRSAQQDCNAPVTCALWQNEKRPRFQEIHHACGTASPMIAYARPSDGLFWQIMLPERLRLDDCTLSTYPSIHSFPFQAHRLWPREFVRGTELLEISDPFGCTGC